MNRTLSTSLMVLGLGLVTGFSQVAQADHDRRATYRSNYEQARVVSATPIYRTVSVPDEQEVCWEEDVRPRHRSHTGAIAGGVIGGAVGRQFGGGRGKDALTAVGAILGATIGNDIQRNRDYRRGGHHHTETVCRVEQRYYQEERVAGYDVSYEYDGRIYQTRTDRHPGDFIDVEVSVRPRSY